MKSAYARSFVMVVGMGGVALVSGGCSVFSGVSDLQGGAIDAGAADTSVAQQDAGAGDTSEPDTSPPPDGNGADSGGATCGATKCAPGVPCCVDFTSRDSKCADSTGCHGTSVPLACTAQSDCAMPDGSSLLCCLSLSSGASCEATCNTPGAQTLCDPNATVPCPNGEQCKPEILIGGFNTCRQ